ncbi:MAG: gas vesicle protein GvpG [Leptolyngbyaceae cyanobacterium SM1_1_3]|nr:gas vesicle protein GvpG [Leptolyngbyaceae cyanobacterium SM1_1_3]NJN03373.1 gas vesicle protein GvpG [Leptolyngbyaceae cyanobacterium RM1_1_2]NJO11806.1 gas vesicle protein GvpG [Leptolyngbyaceae cyanobacterium SL_1_1]
MIFELLLAPVAAPFTGVTWIAKKLLEQAEAELDNTENLQKRLLALQLSFDMGEILETDFEDREEELLVAIQAVQDAEEN